MSSNSNFKIFLSHASEDADLTNKIHGWLLNQSFIDRVWIDKIELNIGDNLREKINQGVSSSDYLIPLITNNSRNRKWVKYEIKTAMKEETSINYKVIPLIHNDCKNIPKYLEHKIYLRINNNLDGLDKIIGSITNRYRLEIKLDSNFKLNENDLREKLNVYGNIREKECYVTITQYEFTNNIMNLIETTLKDQKNEFEDDLTNQLRQFEQFKLTIELFWANLNYLISKLINSIFNTVRESLYAINYSILSIINVLEYMYFLLVDEVYNIIWHDIFIPPLSQVKNFYNEYFQYVKRGDYLYFMKDLYYKTSPISGNIHSFFTKLRLIPKQENTFIPTIYLNGIDLFEKFEYYDQYPLGYILTEDTWYTKCIPYIIKDYMKDQTFRNREKCTLLNIELNMKGYEYACAP